MEMNLILFEYYISISNWIRAGSDWSGEKMITYEMWGAGFTSEIIKNLSDVRVACYVNEYPVFNYSVKAPMVFLVFLCFH